MGYKSVNYFLFLHKQLTLTSKRPCLQILVKLTSGKRSSLLLKVTTYSKAASEMRTEAAAITKIEKSFDIFDLLSKTEQDYPNVETISRSINKARSS
jgi:hypothetical protein